MIVPIPGPCQRQIDAVAATFDGAVRGVGQHDFAVGVGDPDAGSAFQAASPLHAEPYVIG